MYETQDKIEVEVSYTKPAIPKLVEYHKEYEFSGEKNLNKKLLEKNSTRGKIALTNKF